MTLRMRGKGVMLGYGCCRIAGGIDQLLPWSHTPSKATGIPAKHIGVVGTSDCAEVCADHASCTHYELNTNVPQAPEGHGSCWLFKSGGHRVQLGCDTTSGPMVCFAVSDGGGTTQLAPQQLSETSPVLLLVYLSHSMRIPLIRARYDCNPRIARLAFVVYPWAMEHCRQLCNASCVCHEDVTGAKAHVNLAKYADGVLDTLWIHADMWTDTHAVLDRADRHAGAALLPMSSDPNGFIPEFHNGGFCRNVSQLLIDPQFGAKTWHLGADALPEMCVHAFAVGSAQGLLSSHRASWTCCYTWQDLIFLPRAQFAHFRALALGPFRYINQEIATPTILRGLSYVHGYSRPRFVESEGTCCGSVSLSDVRAQHAMCAHRVQLHNDPLVQEGVARRRCAQDAALSNQHRRGEHRAERSAERREQRDGPRVSEQRHASSPRDPP